MVRLIARFDHAAEAAEMDAAFDGGEFSGPAGARALARERDRLARRFGFADADALEQVARGLGLARVGMPAWMHFGEGGPFQQEGGAR